MSFDISQVLSSSMALAFEKSSGKSAQSQINKNAQEAITSVINEYANQLFNDAEFMSKEGLEVLQSFQKLQVTDQEFKEKTTHLSEQLQVVAHLCHSRNLKALDEERSLNSEERSEISQAFANLAEVHASNKELHGKLMILAEATPIVIKVSEAYVKYIRPYDEQLSQLLSELDLPQNVKDSMESYKDICFPESSCTREGLKAIEETKEMPNFSQITYQESLKAFSNYILHLALVAKNENREMNPSEINAVKEAVKALRLKMGITRMAKINFDQLTGIKNGYRSTLEALAQLPVEQKQTTREMSENITKLEKDLNDFKYYTKYVERFKDLSKPIENGRKNRGKKLRRAKVELKNYTKECSEKLTNLQHSKEAKEKLIEKKESEWKAFVAEKFNNPSMVETDAEIKDSMYFRIGLLMENPQILASSASLFIEHLTSKVNRLPEEQPAGWFSGFRIW